MSKELWTLVYETNGSGVQVAGSMQEFKHAVLTGADVKISYNTLGTRWWSRKCSSVNVIPVSGTTVIAATFMEAADTMFIEKEKYLDFMDPFALEYHIYSSTGVRVTMKFNYYDHSLISRECEYKPMKWFVKDYEPTMEWSLRSAVATRVEKSELVGR